MADGPKKTAPERATEMLLTYLGRKQLQVLDLPDAELLEAVRAAVEHARSQTY
jgi:hypothetical protein